MTSGAINCKTVNLPMSGRQVYLTLVLKQGREEKRISALYDTGAGCCTISPETVEKLVFNTKAADRVFDIHNADGTEGGRVTQQLNCIVDVPGLCYHEEVVFAIVPCGDDEAIIGTDFIKRAGLVLDLANGRIERSKLGYPRYQIFFNRNYQKKYPMSRKAMYRNRKKRKKKKNFKEKKKTMEMIKELQALIEELKKKDNGQAAFWKRLCCALCKTEGNTKEKCTTPPTCAICVMYNHTTTNC